MTKLICKDKYSSPSLNLSTKNGLLCFHRNAIDGVRPNGAGRGTNSNIGPEGAFGGGGGHGAYDFFNKHYNKELKVTSGKCTNFCSAF